MFQGLRKVAAGQSDIDFVGKIRIWLTISFVVLGLSLIGILFVRLNFGLSFRGGTSLRAPLEAQATIPQIRDALQEAGVENAEVQIATSRATGDREVLVQSKRIPPGDELLAAEDALAKIAGVSSRAEVNVEDVGPKWGRQVTNKSVQALIVFIILVGAYISFRFELKMAVCALGALFHDLISTAGIYALVGFEVSPATVVALLTILGYSLYDTVVVFDKIKENAQTLQSQQRGTYTEMVNRSVNQTFMRSINTSLTSLIPVAALLAAGKLLIGGAQQLTDLALAMLVGIFVSSYSSIFFASPLLAKWKEREPRYRAMRSRALKQGPVPARGPVFAAAAAGPADVELDGDDESVPAPPTPRAPRPGAIRPVVARPRKRKRGKRRH